MKKSIRWFFLGAVLLGMPSTPGMAQTFLAPRLTIPNYTAPRCQFPAISPFITTGTLTGTKDTVEPLPWVPPYLKQTDGHGWWLYRGRSIQIVEQWFYGMVPMQYRKYKYTYDPDLGYMTEMWYVYGNIAPDATTGWRWSETSVDPSRWGYSYEDRWFANNTSHDTRAVNSKFYLRGYNATKPTEVLIHWDGLKWPVGIYYAYTTLGSITNWKEEDVHLIMSPNTITLVYPEVGYNHEVWGYWCQEKVTLTCGF